MAKLSDLLSTREITANQTNLEKGRVYSYTNTDQYVCHQKSIQFCWQSPGCGTALIEIWGAAGSSSRQCCCAAGLPGNAPAYSKKTIAVFPNSSITSYAGMSCNAHTLCFSGCSEATCLVWESARDLCGNRTGCMCAEGGAAGIAYCVGTGDPAYPYCCFVACGLAGTLLQDACGIVCNYCTNDQLFMPCGYGGDINKCGCYSKVEFWACRASCVCERVHYVPYAAGIFACDGGYLIGPGEADTDVANWSGAGLPHVASLLEYNSPNPSGGVPFGGGCWQSRLCGCYESVGCSYILPYGVAGPAPQPCPGVRDHGYRGGSGAIRITYRGTGTNCRECRNAGGAY